MNEDFEQLLWTLTRHDVRFLVVGGVALGIHGLQRATGDIDIWTKPVPTNAQRMYDALREFGMLLAAFDVAPEDFAVPGRVVQFGLPPRRVDAVTSVDGLEFDGAWDQRAEMTVAGCRVPVISLMDLLRNKQAVGRPQDRVDALAIRRELRKRGHDLQSG